MSDIIYDDAFVRRLISDYMDKLFYFCLKKTGDQYEAENLAADIVLNVLSSHKRWPATVNFSAWFWQIARNRYSVWVRKKDEHDKWISEFDVSEYEITDENAVLDELLQKENIEILRRELAFISSSYREILVAYYIEDKSVKEIATALGISESLVKTNLFRARKALKEGMEMARTFGPRSYNPGKVCICGVRNHKTKKHFFLLRQLAKNILLEADHNPSTVEELSIALGVGVPYMEDEISALEMIGVLKKTGDKYLADFFIADTELQKKVYMVLNKYICNIVVAIESIVQEHLSEIRACGFVDDAYSNDDLSWCVSFYVLDLLMNYENRSEKYKAENYFFGYEDTGECDPPIDRNVYKSNGKRFCKYVYDGLGFQHNKIVMCSGDVEFQADFIKNNRKISSLTALERLLLDDTFFAEAKNDGVITSKLFAFTTTGKNRIKEIVFSHPASETTAGILSEIFDNIETIAAEYYPHDRVEEIEVYAINMMNRLPSMMVRKMMENGTLKIPDNPKTSLACMYLDLGD